MASNANVYQVCFNEYIDFAGFTGAGPQGYTGPQGSLGAQGFEGVQGRQGFQGQLGLVGTQGGTGPIGFQGFQGTDAVGTQGPQGDSGPTGIPGIQGNQGWQGSNALGVQGPQGTVGTQGPGSIFAVTEAYQLMGSEIKSVNLNHLTGWLSTPVTLTNQEATFIPIYVQTPSTLTGVMFEINTQGVYTANNYNGFALYSESSGLLSRQRLIPSDGNIFKYADNTFVKYPFSTPYTTLTPRILYLAVLHCASATTTAPQISGVIANFNLGRMDFANSLPLCGTLSARTSLPSSINASSLTLGNNSYWMNVY